MKILNFLFISLLLCSLAGAQGIDKPQYQIVTHRAGTYLGTINIELFPLIAPLHVANFDSLVADQFYDSTAFHRVVPGFVIQGGDPNSVSGPVSTWGFGQPWQVTVPAEFNPVRHLRGRIGAARDNDPNSATSQFYICVANATSLDNNYTVYGQVTSGMDIADSIVNSPADANDVPLQKIEMFITYTGVNDSIPDAPVLNLPADGATGILNTQTFSWTNVNTAVLYTIEFSTDPGFSSIALTKNTGINSTLETNLQGYTQYYWRVKSNNGGHESVYSNTHSFTTATAAPALVYPADLDVNIPVNAIFNWSSVPNATSYTLQVSNSSTFTTQSMIYNVAGITDTFQLVTNMNPNTVYYWRVRSADATTQGFYSVKYSFTTGTSTTVEELENTITSIYPNPAKDLIIVEGHSESNESSSIKIYDALGKIVLVQPVKILSGKFRFEISLKNISAGSYFLSLSLDGKEITRTIEVGHW